MLVREVESQIAKVAAGQRGVFLATDAFELGATRDQLKQLVRRGWLIRISRGLYRLRDHPWSWESQLQAALLAAGPGSVVSRRSAGRLHGLWAYRKKDVVEVTRREPGDHSISVGTLHRSSWLPSQHVTSLDGFPVTTMARTIFDLAGDPDPGLRRSVIGKELHATQMARVLNEALRSHGLHLLHESAVLAALATRGRSGTVLIRQLIDDFAGEYEPTASDGESLFVELLHASTIDQVPQRQVIVSDEQGFIGVLDFLFDRGKLNVEIDGTTHRGPLDRQRDRERDSRIERIGIQVLRIDYWDLLKRPKRQLQEVQRRLAARTAEV